jgi:hypothetical protein
MLWNSRLDDITNRPKQAQQLRISTKHSRTSSFTISRLKNSTLPRAFINYVFQDRHRPPNCLKRKTKTPQKLEMKTTHTSQDSSGAGINGGLLPSQRWSPRDRSNRKEEHNNLISPMPQSEAQKWREARSTRKAYNTNWNRTSVTSLPCGKEPTQQQTKNLFSPTSRPQTAARNATPGNHLDTRNLGEAVKYQTFNLEKSCERTSQTNNACVERICAHQLRDLPASDAELGRVKPNWKQSAASWSSVGVNRRSWKLKLG